MKLEKARLKLIRIEMSNDIRTLLLSLPIVDFKETQIGDHIYMGNGKIKLGSQIVSSLIRIWSQDGETFVGLKAGNLQAVHLFGTQNDQHESLGYFKTFLNRGWN